MQFAKICNGIKETYLSGRGSITMRGVAEVETIENPGRPDKDAIIITNCLSFNFYP